VELTLAVTLGLREKEMRWCDQVYFEQDCLRPALILPPFLHCVSVLLFPSGVPCFFSASVRERRAHVAERLRVSLREDESLSSAIIKTVVPQSYSFIEAPLFPLFRFEKTLHQNTATPTHNMVSQSNGSARPLLRGAPHPLP